MTTRDMDTAQITATACRMVMREMAGMPKDTRRILTPVPTT